jgi:hypothetical protein
MIMMNWTEDMEHKAKDILIVGNSYKYDSNGNRVRKTSLTGTTTYAYDKLGQLAEEAGSYIQKSYGYDKAGQIQKNHYDEQGSVSHIIRGEDKENGVVIGSELRSGNIWKNVELP